MSDQKNAVSSHLVVTRPPQLSNGDISPKAVKDFENHCLNYFINAKGLGGIDDNLKVTRILGCFENDLVNDWISVNRERFTTLSFEKFMEEFRARWLPHDWEQSIRSKILSARLFPKKQRFEDWASSLQSLNVSLRGTPSHLDDERIRLQLEAGLDEDLQTAARDAKAHEEKSLHPWIARIKELDNRRIIQRKRVADAVEEAMRANKKPFNPSSRYANTTDAKNATSSASSTRDYPPKLTDDERSLLMEHAGCLKCRKFYIGHRAHQCTTTISGKGYKTLTEKDAQRAKSIHLSKTASSSQITTVATVSDATPSNQTEDFVAAVFPSLSSGAVGDGSFTDGSDSSFSSVSSPPPIKSKHFIWNCSLTGPSVTFPVNKPSLIDNGCHMVLIRPDIVEELGLPIFNLKEPEEVDVAISFSKTGGISRKKNTLVHYVKLRPSSSDSIFQSRLIHAVICPGLCMPLIFGLPFLELNDILCDHKNRACIVRDKQLNYNLLKPVQRQEPTPPKLKLRKQLLQNKSFKSDTLRELLEVFPIKWKDRVLPNIETPEPKYITSILHRIKTLELEASMDSMDVNMRKSFSRVFEPIPHVDDLPLEPVARITLKDAEKTIKTRNYPCPRKWKDAWYVLLQQHLDAGRIRPSHASTGSGAFIIPKADPTVLPRWVNDYRQLNSNTITDCFPIPRIDDILADCAKGKIWATIDMTNSFFQTRMHPDDVHLTAVNTPWGLYEWLVMPMGIRNAPAIHQRCVTAALRPFIGKICHVYLDDIVIWSNTLEEHVRNVRTILQALEEAKLYCNPKKTKLFCHEIHFLGHRISARGIEPDEGKADRIKNWPTPKSASDVRSFLGLVRYLAAFLPKLAKFTISLEELTRKECDKDFPGWKPRHQASFEAIKQLVMSTDCLTTIDPRLMPEHKIFVTTDASDTGSGAILSFGTSYDTARPVAYDSRSFKGAELNYPVHEKELLAIIRALSKWRTDLLGFRFEIWTDHKTLIHFENQRDLSRRQARWMEFLSQYDASINYIPGDNNSVADALSRLPESSLQSIASLFTSPKNRSTKSTLQLDTSMLSAIKDGYLTDPFITKISSASTGMDNIKKENDFWFINDRLVIPDVKHVRESLFRLAHDSMGHFGPGKCIPSLKDSFYWPNMRRDLETAYIPSCPACQRNKSKTTKPIGPLHPLPVPDGRCDSVAIDFIGPLPFDNGFDTIITFTDRLGSDIQIIPSVSSLTADKLAEIFFDKWYCENGLPLDIVSDRDKLFMSRFWKTLHTLTGVKLKMSTSYHPETDGSSERTNKTVIQCIRFAVERDQIGWVKALPKIRFDIMNTINRSTGFTPFQLRFGRSPRVLPPLFNSLKLTSTDKLATDLLQRMQASVSEAQDNLFTAKISQAFQSNKSRSLSFPFKIGDRVVLSTLHRRHELNAGDSKRVAKFMPRFDGPFTIKNTNEKHSTVTLDLPNLPQIFPVFHTSEIRPFSENDDSLFPSRALIPPKPITINGQQEFFIDKIVDERKRRKKTQYRVRWQGEGPEGDKWLPAEELTDCEAIDIWNSHKATNGIISYVNSSVPAGGSFCPTGF
jgi:hypothetical protein